ncbi:MAG: protein-L-isoaspartate(D-aspartate) O-methyltransferase [Rhodocyclales bacterium]|nr:protein-L-isoaspartate(D-aspartate) O-methyltransferase [Rhodocyclales bacterium]
MTDERRRDLDLLLDEIREEMRGTRHYTGRAALDERVVAALGAVPRHAFVPDELQYSAYANRPLPIGHGQTISQPYIVALMTDLIRPRADDVVLEIGTGSGYQAAILSRLVKQVYSIEIVDALALQAAARLQRLGYDNVEVRAGNGRQGWPQHAPYDAILVTAAAATIPAALIGQLKPGGSLVIPVGAQHAAQDLVLVTKHGDGRIEQRSVLPVVFVPLTGAQER